MPKQIINLICIGGGGSGSTSNCFLPYDQIPQEAFLTTGGGSGQIILIKNYELPLINNKIEIIIGQGGPSSKEWKFNNSQYWDTSYIRDGKNGTSTIIKINENIFCEAKPGYGGIHAKKGGDGYHGGGITLLTKQTTLDADHTSIIKYNNILLGESIYPQIIINDFDNLDNFGGIGSLSFKENYYAFNNNKISRYNYESIKFNRNIYLGDGGAGDYLWPEPGQSGSVIFF